MKANLKKVILFSVIGVVAIATITSSLIYDAFKKETNSLPMDFENWGEEFLEN